jgi:hypothetical protein
MSTPLSARLTLPVTRLIGSDSERVYVEHQNQLIAVNVASSKVVWRRPLAVPPIQYAFAAGYIYLLERNQRVSSLRSSTGTIHWQTTLPKSATVPTTLAAAAGHLAVGYACKIGESIEQSTCSGTRSTIIVALDPATGKLRWQLKTPAARQYGDLILSSNFVARVKSAATTANPDPQTTYLVLPLPAARTIVDESDLRYVEGSQETDSRPRFIVGSTIITLGDPETRSASLDTTSRLNLETTVLPTLKLQRFDLEIASRPGCGVPTLDLTRVLTTGTTPVLEVQFRDTCGDYKRFWSLGAQPLEIPNSTGQGTVFDFGGFSWGIAVDSSRISRLTGTRVAIALGEANLERYVEFQPPYVVVRERADASVLRLYNLNRRVLVAELPLDKKVLYMPKVLSFETKVAVFQEGRLSIFAVGNR